MGLCTECRWWGSEWHPLAPGYGACMISRTDVDAQGMCRPVIAGAPFTAVADSPHVPAVVITHGSFVCRQFELR